jgi:nuclear pore complex protein Nup85
LNGGPSVEVQQYINRIAKLYLSTILKQIESIQHNTSLDEDAKLDELQHLASLHAVLSLTEILYLPADGRGDGVVGEEVLDWLNTIDRGEQPLSVLCDSSFEVC